MPPLKDEEPASGIRSYSAMRPVQTIKACAVHLPTCLAEMVVSYITPTRAGLEAAVAAGNYEICASADNVAHTAMGAAVRSGQSAIVEMFLGRRAMSDKWGQWENTWLTMWCGEACDRRDFATIAVLHAHGASGMCHCRRAVAAHLPGLQAGGRHGLCPTSWPSEIRAVSGLVD